MVIYEICIWYFSIYVTYRFDTYDYLQVASNRYLDRLNQSKLGWIRLDQVDRQIDIHAELKDAKDILEGLALNHSV